jgi:hypothetical protein
VLVVENFDDDDRAAQRKRDRQIKSVQPSIPKREAKRPQRRQQQQTSTDDLNSCRDQNRATGIRHFLQIDFEADHEKEKNQAEARDFVDGSLTVDEAAPSLCGRARTATRYARISGCRISCAPTASNQATMMHRPMSVMIAWSTRMRKFYARRGL